ncbi:MAG: hypothetical protein GXO86_12975 [Chlorobi bacterium]|nr:hypothetical protein [Chlorobiota bacterium]
MITLQPVFVLAIIFGFIYAIVYIIVRKKERMALLEKEVDASIWLAPSRPSIQGVRFGLLFIGVAIGILLGATLVETTSLNEEAAYFSMIFLFGGIGLVITHFIERKEMGKEK